MSLVTQLNSLATQMGGDVKALYVLITGAANITTLTGLNTATKANLVAAINEVFALANSAASSGGAVIDDATARGTTTYSSTKSTAVANAAAAALIADGATAAGTTWSSTKINTAVGNVLTQVQTILAGSTAAYDTFKEVSDYIASDVSGAAAMTASIAAKIDTNAAQTFTAGQLTQGLANLVTLGVAKQVDLAALTTAVGDTTTNFVTAYNTAKNS